MQKFKLSTVPLLLALLFLSACATSTVKNEERNLPFVGDYQVQKFVYKNGLTLLVVEDSRSPTFAYQTWFDVGSRDEKAQYTGLAHLFEHMMFRATKNRAEGEFDRILDSIGVQGKNAFTSRDYTAYIQQLPKEHLDLIAELEADRMQNLIVNQKSFKTETEVVQNERRYRNENNPAGKMWQTLFEVSHEGHPYGWPIIGYQEDLDRMNAEDALKFYKQYYRPNNATIVVVGDVDAGDVAKTVDKYYGKIPPAEVERNPNLDTIAEQKKFKKKRLELNTQIEKLFMGYQIPKVDHPDTPVFEVIQAVLTDGKSSRLHRRLVKSGLATSIDSGSFQFKHPGTFIILGDLQKGKKALVAERLIMNELKKLGDSGITEQELQRAKNKVKFAHYSGLGSSYSKARFLGSYQMTAGDYRHGLRIQRQIAAVTANDVKKVANEYFKPSNRTVIMGVPKK